MRCERYVVSHRIKWHVRITYLHRLGNVQSCRHLLKTQTATEIASLKSTMYLHRDAYNYIFQASLGLQIRTETELLLCV